MGVAGCGFMVMCGTTNTLIHYLWVWSGVGFMEMCGTTNTLIHYLCVWSGVGFIVMCGTTNTLFVGVFGCGVHGDVWYY